MNRRESLKTLLSAVGASAMTISGCARPGGVDAPNAPADAGPPLPKEAVTPGDLTAPMKYQVEFNTTKGKFVIEVDRSWAPIGADHFYTLVKSGFYDGCKFFRVIPDFMVQFGINGDPATEAKWKGITLKDDPVRKSNLPTYVTYAKTGAPNSRSTQIFISYVDNSRLDADNFAPFGKVISGMDNIDSLNSKYQGTPSDFQPEIEQKGNAFLDAKFPGLDGIITAKVVEPAS